MRDSGEGALCLICHEALLSLVPCALRCGHVYHSVCCQQWLLKGRGECPQCKKPCTVDKLRLLEFEVAPVQTGDAEEVLKLQAASESDRAELLAEIKAQLEEANAGLKESEVELQRQQEEAQQHKRARRELDQSAPRDDEAMQELREEKDRKLVDNTSLRSQVDYQNSVQRQMRGRLWSRETLSQDDPDCKEERRKLRTMRPADRAKQLHEAVVAARQQETEASRVSAAREELFQELEERRKVLRKLLRQDSFVDPDVCRARRLPSELDLDLDVGMGQVSAPGGARKAEARLARVASSADASASSASSAPMPARQLGKPRQAPEEQPADEEDILYGGPKKRTAAVGLLAMKAMKAAPQPGQKATPAAMSALVTPARKTNCLRALFSQKRLPRV